ncbi:putative peptidase [Nostocoides japonicum T1-X7]|uniref:Putative peptidase n=1 Tax=Nostocoides japonicum T1-X7 TaxID=1194083 RepID=A0A077LZX0_9MICO|nr:M20/M25/M40 family metallo-hydrolase [Tetrasphaera japonica]CCH79141.1 putative peptidase [Tetrasphaera japonica T1-X7]
MDRVRAATGDEEVCRLTAELIRHDTTNRGGGDAAGEREAAEYVAALLDEVGIGSVAHERAPGRTNLIARWPGNDPALPALILHGHLDVVPADASEWSVPPFSGEIRDGMIWGRGAVDMKNMVAMMVATVRSLVRAGFIPRQDIILAFFADEEDNSHYGARWLVNSRPEVFRGATVAIGEVGGFSVDVRGNPVFLIQTGEKGILWIDVRCHGRATHASQLNPDNPVHELARSITRIAAEPWPVTLTKTTSLLLDELRATAGLAHDADPLTVAREAGVCAQLVTPGLANVVNGTLLQAGYKQNVVPSEATASLDIRFLPGQRDAVLRRIRELAGPHAEVIVTDEVDAVETVFGGRIVEIMRTSLKKYCRSARIAPYLLPAGTDNAMLAELGISGYGFVPMLLPAGYDFPAMFHGIDERVPLDALLFGQAVLTELIRTS